MVNDEHNHNTKWKLKIIFNRLSKLVIFKYLILMSLNKQNDSKLQFKRETTKGQENRKYIKKILKHITESVGFFWNCFFN